jgi:site-specific DNA recombinase
MASEYENEQNNLIASVEICEKELAEAQQKSVDMKMLFQGLREFTDMKELTPLIVNKLIERIEIYNNEKKNSHNNVKAAIYFTAISLFDIPTEQDLLEVIEELQNERKIPKLSA